MKLARPRLILDIKTRSQNPFARRLRQVNFFTPVIRIRLKQIIQIIGLGAIGIYFLLGFVIAPHQSYSLAATDSGAERAQLERQLADLESQISAYESTVADYKKQGSTLKSEINLLNSKINKLNLQIKAINLSLTQLSQDIKDNEDQIVVTQSKLDFNKEAMRRSLRQTYENERESLLAVLLKNSNLTDFFGDLDNLLAVQNSLIATVDKINELKGELLDEKESLAIKRNDAVAYKAYQDAQRELVLSTKKQKDQLLTVTKGQESKYQDLLKQTKQTAAQIRNRIFEILGGGEMTFEQAYEFAKFAEQATGVKASLILAALDRESALGQNVGRCNYKTAMAPGPPLSKRNDVAPFLQITSELGINPDSVTVSCANADGAYGGAMGPAQFIPTTWMLYRDRIASLTGSNPPSPWKNGDAFVASALYFKDALAGCGAYSGLAQQRCAAARYYGGSSWRRYLYTYGANVVAKAEQFEQDINVLNS